MRSFLYQSGKVSQPFSTTYNSLSLSTSSKIYQKPNSKINKNIQQGLKTLFNNSIGLQSILLNEGNHFVDRTLIEEPEECKQGQSDTKSIKSESNSLKTHVSSTSTGANSIHSNNEASIPSSININEDLTQKYYHELKNSLKNCILTKKPSVCFNDIAGNTYAKKIINEAFVIPILVPNYFNGKPKAWNKILLYGPPGVGKTMLAQAVCNEVNATVFWVSLADITSKFIGESEKLLRILFDLAREKSPSIIILDEMDSIGRKRNGNESETERRIKTEFLRQMDGINSGADKVFVLATTNMPWELDIAALRRFERKILLPMPDLKAREEIFKINLNDHPSELSEDDFKFLATLTEGYSGSDISTVINDALMKPVRMLQETSYFKSIQIKKPKEEENLEEFYEEKFTPCEETDKDAVKLNLTEIQTDKILLRKVNINDFKESVKNCKPTVHSSFLELYNKFLLKYGHIEQKNDLAKEQKEYQSYYL